MSSAESPPSSPIGTSISTGSFHGTTVNPSPNSFLQQWPPPRRSSRPLLAATFQHSTFTVPEITSPNLSPSSSLSSPSDELGPSPPLDFATAPQSLASPSPVFLPTLLAPVHLQQPGFICSSIHSMSSISRESFIPAHPSSRVGSPASQLQPYRHLPAFPPSPVLPELGSWWEYFYAPNTEVVRIGEQLLLDRLRDIGKDEEGESLGGGLDGAGSSNEAEDYTVGSTPVFNSWTGGIVSDGVHRVGEVQSRRHKAGVRRRTENGKEGGDWGRRIDGAYDDNDTTSENMNDKGNKSKKAKAGRKRAASKDGNRRPIEAEEVMEENGMKKLKAHKGWRSIAGGAWKEIVICGKLTAVSLLWLVTCCGGCRRWRPDCAG